MNETQESTANEFMLALLEAYLDGKTEEQFIDEWLHREERKREAMEAIFASMGIAMDGAS